MTAATTIAEPRVTYAGFWRRFGALIVDAIVLVTGNGVLLLVL